MFPVALIATSLQRPMGFASELQGWSSHDALLSVQDAELRLLENMRRCIVHRVKCDREYSLALSALCVQAAKVDTGDELSGSLVAKLRDAVLKSTSEYEKCIENAAAAKEKYEDQFMKGRGNKKVEEAKERYVKATRKLHQAHNDYILLLNEAMNYEHHLRTTLLPGYWNTNRPCSRKQSIAGMLDHSSLSYVHVQC
ncbi:hypothetical protein HPB48_007088 [Haemaphysalis longicornis]|uniref:FCH domain-containing protein n=1 Tax=Haemaphysalis longicornis TaxID=44386 RepID=A0A9J6FRR9_HAELO|nr:hypothetical protein HPB48_007088 [Haemaphysalis longicornis]